MPVPEQTSSVLLDTHIWIWLQAGGGKPLGRDTRDAIRRAANGGRLLLSAISVWELGMLEAKGRVKLHLPCSDWVAKALATPGLTLVQLTPQIAIESSRLPGSLQSDPADRIIAATARCMGASLVTFDEKLRSYAQDGHLRLA
jgi:PIN domain nuclease of toxin-antitoxin system